MSRLNGFADLTGRSVGIWGFGVEGAATLRRIEKLVQSVVLVDDLDLHDPKVLVTGRGGYERLRECDVVLKSPGIPRRRDDVISLEAHGVTVTSALNLWLHDVDRSRVIEVTGTKGKSTTTSLITFFLNALDVSAVSAGNIGAPPYDPDVVPGEWTVLEVSSFQAVDLELAPGIVVVTSLGADHLDWHGSLEQYEIDKLSLTRTEGPHLTLVADSAAIRQRQFELGGDVRLHAPANEELTAALGLVGHHNDSNVTLAIAATAAATNRDPRDILERLMGAAATFQPLPGRLTVIRSTAGVRFVDDGLATSPMPTVAALEVFDDEPVALIVGGFDRGVDYTLLASALAHRSSPTTVIAMPAVGERIITTIRERTPITCHVAAKMDEAVRVAYDAVRATGGIVLLSPAAPSFGDYANWQERSHDFARVVKLTA